MRIYLITLLSPKKSVTFEMPQFNSNCSYYEHQDSYIMQLITYSLNYKLLHSWSQNEFKAIWSTVFQSVGTRYIENVTSDSNSHSFRQEEIFVTSCLYRTDEVTGWECVGHRKFLTQSGPTVKLPHSPIRVPNFTPNNNLHLRVYTVVILYLHCSRRPPCIFVKDRCVPVLYSLCFVLQEWTMLHDCNTWKE
jgi:hypothetical protein